jgi:hypothetical protein
MYRLLWPSKEYEGNSNASLLAHKVTLASIMILRSVSSIHRLTDVHCPVVHFT